MKKLNLLRLAATFSLSLFLFSSCSKDALNKEQTNSGVSASGNPITVTRDDDSGGIQATVPISDPPAYMIVFNDDFKSDKIYANAEGLIEVMDIPVGVYSAEFHNIPEDEAPRNYVPLIITDIKVYPREVVNLGNIEF